MLEIKKANIEEIGADIPEKYNVEMWESFNLSDVYTQIEAYSQK